jgi:primosomal protein N' (replication factor Y)
MPSVEIVDLRQELKAGNATIFSRVLVEELEKTLAAGHQALLFLNRRGSATVVVCRDCGYVVRCPACEIPFTYHAAFTSLICHRCDQRAASPRTCPECGGKRIRYLGTGTERVEEETRRLFPGARVQRWDRDVTGAKGAHEAILDRFGRHEADILVGTQMIAKGLDFPLVTLVGVISADVGLHLPDFRAPERTFQLVAQVAGRAGRADLPSRVIVQSYAPDHYAITAARDHDYWSFYRQEMTFRHSTGYPPYSRLLRLVARGPKYEDVRRRAWELQAELAGAIASRGLLETEIIGPAPAFVARVKGIYQWHVVVRGPEIHPLLDIVPDDWIVDVDPVDLL